MKLSQTILKTALSGNEQFRKLMGVACWSAAETARQLGVSESSISAYINNNQVPPQAKINLLRLLVDQFVNSSTINGGPISSVNKPYLEPGQAAPAAAPRKKSLREIRLEALLHRIETLAGGLRFFENEEEKVDAAKELSALASELAEKLRTSATAKGKG
jgi:transcriptional regulator with XRE-family HTH domain